MIRRKVIILLLICCSVPVMVQDQKETLISRKRELEKEIELTNKLIEDTRRKRENSLNELVLIKEKVRQRNALISELQTEISQIEADIAENQVTLQSLLKDLDKVKKEYASLIYHAFKNRNSELNFMYLLASESFNQFYIRLKYLQQYKAYRKKQVALIERLNLVIEHKIRELTASREEKRKLMNEALSMRATLISDSKETDRIVEVLQQREEELRKQLKEKERIAQKLEKEIEELIKREARNNTFARLTPEEKIISTDFANNLGRLPWPTQQGVITDRFGEHPHPVIKNLMVRNNGIDISTIPGAEVRAIFDGVVSKVFSIKGANTTVIIRHGNYYTVYHNLTSVMVKVGDQVRTKQVIGTVFSGEDSNETRLHFEIWKELEKQDPEKWLSN